MAIINVRQYFLDTLVEMIGIKSGLALTIPEAQMLLDRDPPDEGWWKGSRRDPLRLELVEIEIVFLKLLYLVGAIPDDRHPKALLFEYARHHNVVVPHESSFAEDLPELPQVMSVVNYLETVLLEHLNDRVPLPSDLLESPSFPDLVKQFAMREIMDGNMPDSRTWDGTVKLSDLFQSEEAPSDSNVYFDQRFIDYLHTQTSDLTRMHWRQFEYLTGEYFRRLGYRVTIGPGRADGGIDVRAEKERVFAGPEVIIIQCKRKGKGKEVEIEEIKALWADVQDERAAGGLMATTTRLAKGARDYCDARHYRLHRAEGQNVVQWLREMASHKPRPSR